MKQKANESIRLYAKQKGIKLWQIADSMGYVDASFSRIMRDELDIDKKEKIVSIIDHLVEDSSYKTDKFAGKKRGRKKTLVPKRYINKLNKITDKIYELSCELARMDESLLAIIGELKERGEDETDNRC